VTTIVSARTDLPQKQRRGSVRDQPNELATKYGINLGK
jgi:hypothetical protein